MHLAVALLLLALAVLLPGRALVEALRPGLGDDPALRGGALLLRALLGFHGALLLVLERLRALARPGSGGALLERGLLVPAPVRAGEAIALAALLLLATALRFHGLDQALWHGEVELLVHEVRRPTALLLTTYDDPGRSQLFVHLARASLVVFGESAWSLRLPATALGLAGLYALWRLARLVAPRREVLFAVGLLALSYHHVWFSQEAEGTTALLCFTTLASEALLRQLAARGPWSTTLAWAYGLSMALAIWTHPIALLVLAAHVAVWAPLAWRSRGRVRALVRWSPALGFLLAPSLSLGAYALALDPLIATLSAASAAGAPPEWRSPLWLARQALGGVAEAFPGGPAASLAFLALALAVGLLGLRSYARQSWAVLGVLLGGALATASALSLLRLDLWPRLLFVGAGGFALVLGRGLVEWVRLFARHPPLSAWSALLERALLTLVCLASAATLPRAWAPRQDLAGALAFLDARLDARDAVVSAGRAVLPLRELHGRAWPSVEDRSQLEAIERAHPRTWVVLCAPLELRRSRPQLWEHLAAGYEREALLAGTARDGEVLVLLRRR